LKKLVNKATSEVRKWSRPKTKSCKNVIKCAQKLEEKVEAYRKGKERRGGGTMYIHYFSKSMGGILFIIRFTYNKDIKHMYQKEKKK
jgi:hypothetical protein